LDKNITDETLANKVIEDIIQTADQLNIHIMSEAEEKTFLSKVLVRREKKDVNP
jgi:hypothetical protein